MQFLKRYTVRKRLVDEVKGKQECLVTLEPVYAREGPEPGTGHTDAGPRLLQIGGLDPATAPAVGDEVVVDLIAVPTLGEEVGP